MQNVQIPVSLPFSGSVTQAINPWSWMLKSTGGQFGLVNINLGASTNPSLEQEILDKIGSYGRQLGRMGDALGVLIKHVDRKVLDEKERRALTALEHQLDEIAALKEKHGGQ